MHSKGHSLRGEVNLLSPSLPMGKYVPEGVKSERRETSLTNPFY